MAKKYTYIKHPTTGIISKERYCTGARLVVEDGYLQSSNKAWILQEGIKNASLSKLKDIWGRKTS